MIDVDLCSDYHVCRHEYLLLASPCDHFPRFAEFFGRRSPEIPLTFAGHSFSKALESRDVRIQILILVHVDPPLKDTEPVPLCTDHMMDLELNR
jgi:hypothetical protein